MTPWRIALGYTAFSSLALALFAIPLWDGWRVNLATIRNYVSAEEQQPLVDMFTRGGPTALVHAVRSRSAALPKDEVLIFASPDKKVLAGTLRAWPATVPDVPGVHGVEIGTGPGSSMRVVASHVVLPGGYHLLMGRESVRFESLVERFWYGMAAALVVVLALGGAIAWLIARRTTAIRHSEERYALAIGASGEGHWDWNIVTDEFYASPRCLELGGFPPDFKYTSRADAFDRIPFHPDDRPKYEAAVAAHFAGETPRMDIVIRVTPNGELRWLHAIGMCSRDAAGKPVRWAGSVNDITERMRAEEAQRLSEERYALAMRASEAGHWDWNIVTDEFYASPRFLEFGGFPADIRYSKRSDIVPRIPYYPGDGEAWESAVAAHFAGETPRVDMEIRVVPNGQLRWLHVIGMCLRDADGNPVRWAGSVTDVTARKLAEEKLRLSEQRYSLALAASDEGHFDHHVGTDELFTSDRLNEIYGVPLGTRFDKNEDYLKHFRFYGNDGEIYKAALRAAVAQGAPDRHELVYRIVRPSGEMRWLRMRSKVTRDAEGRALRCTGVVADITDRRRAEAELRASEERFATVFRESPALMALHRLSDGSCIDINPAWSETFGYTRDQVIGRNTRELGLYKDPSQRDEFYAMLRRDGSLSRVSMTFLRADGEERTCLMSARVIEVDGEKLFIIGGNDITERKRVEDALRVSEDRYAVAMGVSAEGHLDWNVATQEFFASDQAKRVMNLPPGVQYHTRDDFMGRVPYHPDDLPRVREAWRASLAGPGSEHDLEYRVMRGEEARWIHARWKIFRDEGGALQRVIGVVSDITERKLAEEGLRKMERELRQAQRLEAMGTLAGGIAHDFNNILGAILGYGEMAMRDAKDSSRLRRDLESIMAAGERGRSLVDRVLAFSRSGVGEKVPVHVEAVVREAIDQVAAKLPENVTLRPQLRAGRAAMLGDSTQVHQVVMNLATNAVHAMPNGGTVRVTLESLREDAARPATVGSLVPGNYIVLTISDTGVGIQADVLERMFDPFFTTKEVGVGSGLGLSLVHGIVTSVEGAIDVATMPGKGTTFSVYLRRSGDVPAKHGSNKAADEDRTLPHGAGQRVLVVDDEEPLVRLATETLERLGYSPVGFTSSAAALAAFRADPARFDAVLTDERMPGMSGTALIREVRGIRLTIPIVMMSGHPRMDGVEADVVVRKPLSARDLATSMARALHP